MIRTSALIAALLLATPAMAAKLPKGDSLAVANFASCAKPVWPDGAIAANHVGTVTLAFDIEADGKVAGSKVVRSSGHRDLDEAAREGISKCTFKPGTQNGKRARSSMHMQYVWTLE